MTAKQNKCCCVTPDCVLVTDDFNNGGAVVNPPPTADWSVEGGEWGIANNRLEMITEGPIVTTFRQSPASYRANTDYSIKMFFRIENIGTGTTHKVICGYTDVDNYYFIEYTESGGSLYPAFYHRTGGSDGSPLMDITTHPGGVGFPVVTSDPSNHTCELKICYSDADWTTDEAGGSSESGNGIFNEGSENTWTYDGDEGQASLPSTLGQVGFLKGKFDDFALHYHWEALATCDYCSCMCVLPGDITEYKRLPETLYVSFEPVSGTGADTCPLNSVTFAIYQGVEPSSGAGVDLSPRKWVWSNKVGSDGSPSGPSVFLYCEQNADDSLKFKLAIAISVHAGWTSATTPVAGYPTTGITWDESTCDPIYLVFRDLKATAQTCEVTPGMGDMGFVNPICGLGCVLDGPGVEAAQSAMRWKVIVSE